MVKTRRVTRKRGGPAALLAFSLVEMMIALLILGFGLLVVGASLPIGLEYSRKSADLAVGEAAAEYGLDVIAGSARLSPDVLRDSFFRPRSTDKDGDGFVDLEPNIEPLIKVRPFVGTNVDATPDAAYAREYRDLDSEGIIGIWVTGNVLQFAAVMGNSYSSAARVFPPISPAPIPPYRPFTTDDFFAAPYQPRPVINGQQNPVGAETIKIRERTIGWTAFYRRVSYTANSDDALYEVISIATRRPSANHRYARQDHSPSKVATALVQPTPYLWNAAGSYTKGQSGPDRVNAEPWLVVFQTLPPLPVPPAQLVGPDRTLPVGAIDSRTLEFTASYEVAQLLPPGSIFIPAVNDAANSANGGLRGFVPHSPDTLPIYEVVDRQAGVGTSAPWVISVKNNGLYPWVAPDPTAPTAAAQWPVWVIPPAVRADGSRTHVFDNKSPIIGIARRFVRFPEIP
ncbi:MAG: hypothetical protein CHACPFDD_01241 [Phycisphaerae bacterium]|nr:hypothetical protein [Phycisphaerae bacterium]